MREPFSSSYPHLYISHHPYKKQHPYSFRLSSSSSRWHLPPRLELNLHYFCNDLSKIWIILILLIIAIVQHTLVWTGMYSLNMH
jgi:hypothetical protein